MLTLRLQRVGRKHDPSYRIVATNSRTGPKSNKHVEILGHYDAIRKTRSVNAEAVKKHLANGATVSETLRNILIDEGVMEGRKNNVLPKKSPIIDEEAIAAAKAAEEEAAAEAEAQAAAEAEAAEETPAETEEATEEAPAEEESEESAEEVEAPAEEEKAEG